MAIMKKLLGAAKTIAAKKPVGVGMASRNVGPVAPGALIAGKARDPAVPAQSRASLAPRSPRALGPAGPAKGLVSKRLPKKPSRPISY
jgi:hypothetical protein